MSNESVNNKFVNVTNGYGQLCEVGARATLGATVEVNVDAHVKSLRESDIQNWIKEECQKLSKTGKGKAHQLETEVNAKIEKNNWIGAILNTIGFGVSAKAGYDYENHNKNINVEVNDSN